MPEVPEQEKGGSVSNNKKPTEIDFHQHERDKAEYARMEAEADRADPLRVVERNRRRLRDDAEERRN